MEFTLREFAQEELKRYKVKRVIPGNIDTPEGSIQEFSCLMLIYKARLRGNSPNLQDGGRSIGALNGKSFKADKLQMGDIIIVEGLEYKIADILPRIYADFDEFSLELMRNEE
ncbi:hypothetical protein MVQ18_10235 [Fusobacterium necrophorum]|uniref:hypothetical protein n=1 Tax=Fusobacterium necrophorum TaxID=859 RepID=UPI00254EAE22|nr:hypothetical protein [Fusobacterium necrophorum]MDK4517121.1 hypothetical protein [Fusobacterium necrophorum]